MFIEVNIEIEEEGAEIIIAELAEIGFSSFEQYEGGVKGYVEHKFFLEGDLVKIIEKYTRLFQINYQIAKIEKTNWNEEWEKSFQPIEIEGLCRVRASFHKADPKFRYEIVINPKMSFGTGHHSTTSLMIEFLLEQEVQGKVVADIGCGTGILAILASKAGAQEVLGLEIEDWSVDNARENAAENGCNNIEILYGTISENSINKKFDLIVANINKNVLLKEITAYQKLLKSEGRLIISGFYEEDIKDLEHQAAQAGLLKGSVKVKDRWAALLFKNQ